MRALFIYNPVSGQVNIERELVPCLDSLIARGWSADLRLTSEPRHATELARSGALDGCDLVVAVGGDGTVSEVANGLVGTPTVMGVIPAGTTNVWALQMAIPSLPPWHPRKVVDRVLADLEDLGWHRPAGTPTWLSGAFEALLAAEIRSVDVGMVDGQHFLMWCGVGFDARVAAEVEPEDRRRYGALAFIATSVSLGVEYAGSHMQLTLGDRQVEDEVLMVLAANARLYGGVIEIAPNAYLDDGLLDVCVFKGEGIGTKVRHVTAVLSRRQILEPQFDYAQVDRLRVESEPSEAVHLDSEPWGRTPVDIRVVPRGLQVAVPPGGSADLFRHPRLGLLQDRL